MRGEKKNNINKIHYYPRREDVFYSVFDTCSDHTHYDTPFLKPSAYKARVGDVSPQCGIKQIRESGIDSSIHS